jgi:hypothetical protein
MPTTWPTEFDQRLAALSRHLDDRIRQLQEHGQFTDEFERVAKDIEERQMRLNARVFAAIKSGTSWELVQAELERDHSALLDSVTRFEQQIDADFAKPSAI